MRLYLPNHRRVFYASDNPNRALILLAGFNGDIEYPFQALSLVLSRVFAPFRSGYQCPVFTFVREHTMETGKVDSEFRHQGGQSGNKIR